MLRIFIEFLFLTGDVLLLFVDFVVFELLNDIVLVVRQDHVGPWTLGVHLFVVGVGASIGFVGELVHFLVLDRLLGLSLARLSSLRLSLVNALLIPFVLR